MIEFFVKRPATTIMFISFFVVLGIVSMLNLQIEETPKIDFPIVTVTTTYPGATPLEVETLVTNKIEDAVAEIAGIRQLKSESYDNFGYVSVEFNLSEDVNVKFIEVKDKVEGILNDLPDGAEKPVIEKFDPLMAPVMDLVLLSDTVDGRDLYEFADKKLKDKFAAVTGVASVDVYGGKERQINVILDPLLMKRHYVTINDVINAINAKNKNVPGGLLEKGDNSLSLRFLGEFDNPQEISDMILVSRDGRSFPLKEIARVEDSFKKVETISHFNGEYAVGLSLTKVSDGNAIDISREVRRQLNVFRSELPEGVTLEIATDTTTFIIDETNDTYYTIIIGIILTILIIYFFTGQFGLTFIAAIVIPSSIVSSLILVDASGFTINRMTLLALATVLGTLIANAIVIIENVLVHLDKGEDSVNAAIKGTQEVAAAVFASAGTNLVVFTPIASMEGIIGQFFKSFGLTVVYATLFSIIASFTLTPMLCGLILKKKDHQRDDKKKPIWNPFQWIVVFTNKMMDFLKKEYKIIFDAIFRFPIIAIIIVVFSFYSMKFVVPYIENNFLPKSDENMITVKIEMPQGSTIDRTLKVTKFVEKRIKEIQEVKSYLTSIGEDGVENAAVVINLVPTSMRDKADTEIIEDLIPFMSTIPDAEINIERGEARGGITGDISIDVYGKNYDRIIELSQIMKQKMEATGYFRSVKSSYKTPKKEIRFIPDRKKLVEYGISDVFVGRAIRASVYGDDTNIYKEEGEEYDINVELDDIYTEDFDDLKQIDIISTKGMIPVVELGDLKEAKAMPQIRHREKVRVIRLEGYLAKSSTAYVRGVIDKTVQGIFEDGYGYKYVEMAEHEQTATKETGKAFLLAVILTFMLLCAVMNSFLYPIPILLSVATSFIGVFLSMLFLNQTINIASMLGMVMIVGLVVNNSILMLDYTILKINEGVELKEALWLGASEKFRPIIMTSLAIILGIVPQLTSVVQMKSSMAAVMIGAMIASIVFTFIFTPVAFLYIVRFSNAIMSVIRKH